MPTHLMVVNVVLQNQYGQICLFERQNTESSNGLWIPPGGRAEKGESAYQVACREVKEEIGVELAPEDLDFLAIYDRPINGEGELKRALSVIFLAKHWQGEPTNMEPHKHGEPMWFSLDNIPDKTHPMMQEIISNNFKPFFKVQEDQ